ncbi:hypothetical protein J2810_002762 [Chryseobacterium rhizosphaerae]|uniref:hypothetical protein n=1 Tax=Chryseobacterium rhizosphaerae TaxID=395937 RepID=UPI00286058A3|nr:hypothetical protein [Chryseobacterium rhizosphaerae]MDR6546702.1 hypothetical protein [Chryseobacterium rhizosphaerae]
MKNIVLLISLFVTSFLSAQELLPPPPPEIEITAEKKALVDELIKVTNFEKYVNSYCKPIVLEYAKQNNWDDNKTKQILENSNFKFFNRILYYTFKDDSKENLKELIKSFKQINQKRKPDEFLIPNNFQMQKDMTQFISGLIQGQLLINK